MKKVNKHMNEEKKQKIKINYVALGDAFVSGFNSKIGFSTNGFLNDNNKIFGLCYPSFLAKLISQNKDFELNSFYNFGIINASFDIIQSLYTNDKKTLKKLSNKIDLIQSIDWFSSNPFKNYFSNFLKDWNINNNDFAFFNNTIKKANLITLTAGFYDFIHILPFKEILSLRKLKNEDKEKQILLVKNKIKEGSIEIERKLISLISNIKSINQNAKIILTNYSPLFLNLKNIINTFLNKFETNKFDLYLYLENTLNLLILNAAKSTSIDFIDIHDDKYWSENKKYLFENIFSIYPNEKGYKKIGMDIYTKLFINKKNLQFDFNNITFINNYILNQEFWTRDLKSYISINKSSNNIDLFNEVYGKNKNENIYLSDENEIKNSGHLSFDIKITDFLSLVIRYGKFPISNISKKIISEKFSEIYQKYDFFKKINIFLSNEQRSKEAVLILLKDRKIDNILYSLEKVLMHKNLLENKEINYELVKNELSKILKTEQNMVYDVLKYFFSSGLINESKKEIKEIFEIFIKESLNTDLLNYLFNFKNNKKFEQIKSYLSSLNSFKEFLDFFIESLINYSDIYVKLDNFDQLWNKFIIKNKYNLLLLFDKMLGELTNDEKIEKTIDFFTQSIKGLLRLEIESKDYKIIKNSISEILNICKNNTEYLNNIFVKFLDNLKNISIYNLFFLKKIKKYKFFKKRYLISFNRFFIISLKLVKNLLKIKQIISKYKI